MLSGDGGKWNHAARMSKEGLVEWYQGRHDKFSLSTR